ncbi:MAG: glycerate kinase [Desulfobacterales bacterium]|nr:glycerate kinase [Desulfobacterales bacterium]
MNHNLNIIVAPNAFKGSLTADQAALAMVRGIHKISPDICVTSIPVSDGGDGLVAAMTHALGGQILTASVHDPRERRVKADFLFDESGSTAVIEMALASGLALLPGNLQDPTLTTTLGTGELIRAALDRGAAHILMGIGGSATCDGGMGAAAALGYRFKDKNGRPLPPTGASLGKVDKIDKSGVDPRLSRASFSVACDVTNPLTGPDGASFVFSPQKGATPGQVRDLDRGLAHFGRIISRDLGVEITDLEGAGAAGGLGGGMKAFFTARLLPGIDMVLDLVDFHTQVKDADLVLTAEGRMDSQTRFNKAPAGVARAAKAANVPCYGLCGSRGKHIRTLHPLGMDAVFPICPGPISLASALEEAFDLLSRATEQAVRAFSAGRKS